MMIVSDSSIARWLEREFGFVQSALADTWSLEYSIYSNLADLLTSLQNYSQPQGRPRQDVVCIEWSALLTAQLTNDKQVNSGYLQVIDLISISVCLF